MKKTKEKEKLEIKIIKIVILVILLIGFIYFGTIKYQKQEDDDIRFSEEYKMVTKDNVFHYITASRLINIIKHEKGIIFMGFKENSWSNYYASLLNDVAKSLKIKEIYYYNFYNDRKSDNSDYEKIVNLLKNELTTNDEGKANLTAPSLLIVNEGKVLVYDDETSFIVGNTTPQEYWSEYQKNIKKETFKAMLNNYLKV